MDEEPKEEQLVLSTANKRTLTLQQVIELGEYNSAFLSMFAEWNKLTPHLQWQLIRKALDNRLQQIMSQYAELNNVLDLRNKPIVKEAIRNVEKQLKKLSDEKEKLYIEWSSKF